jgi:hypothetical protein
MTFLSSLFRSTTPAVVQDFGVTEVRIQTAVNDGIRFGATTEQIVEAMLAAAIKR